MKRIILSLFLVILLIGITQAVTINSFNNSLSSENLTFPHRQLDTPDTTNTQYLANFSGVPINRSAQKINLTGTIKALYFNWACGTIDSTGCSGNILYRIRNSSTDAVLGECNVSTANLTGIYSRMTPCTFTNPIYVNGEVYLSLERNITSSALFPIDSVATYFRYSGGNTNITGNGYRYNGTTWLNINDNSSSRLIVGYDIMEHTRYLSVPIQANNVTVNAVLNLSEYSTQSSIYNGLEFTTANNNPTTITTNGTYLFILDGNNEEVYRHHFNGTGIGSLFDSSSQCTNNAGGITYISNSDRLYVGCYGGAYGARIYSYFTNGTYTGTTFNATGLGTIYSLSTYNDNLWINNDTLITEYFTNGTATGNTIADPFGTTGGSTFYNGYLYLTRGSTDSVYKYFVNGTSTGIVYTNITMSTNFENMILIYNNTLYTHINGSTSPSYVRAYNFYEVSENPSISLGNTNVWNFTGLFNQTNNQTLNLSTVLNSYLSSCTYSNGYCNVPFTFFSNNSAILQVSALNFSWIDAVTPLINISQPRGVFNTTNISFQLNATDNYLLDRCLYWVTRGASIEVANTTVACSSNILEYTYVSSNGTSYAFHFFINDTSGNANYTTQNFSTSSGAVIVNPPSSAGGGGGTVIIDGSNGWTMEVTNGNSRYDKSMTAGTSLTLSVQFENTGSSSRQMTFSCINLVGSICQYIEFPEKTFTLALLQDTKQRQKFTIVLPESIEDGTYQFNIRATDDQQQTGDVTVVLKVGGSNFISLIFTKLTSSTSAGIPYLLIFLGSLFVSLIFSAFALRKVPFRPLWVLLISFIVSFGSIIIL